MDKLNFLSKIKESDTSKVTKIKESDTPKVTKIKESDIPKVTKIKECVQFQEETIFC